MKLRFALTAIGITLLTVPNFANAQDLQKSMEGRYDLGSCKGNSDGGLDVTATSYEWWETSCQILSASVQGDGMLDVMLSCAGEGEEWQRAISVFKDDAGDLFIEEDGNLQRYQACR